MRVNIFNMAGGQRRWRGTKPHRGRNHVVTRGENCVEWFAAADWRGGEGSHHQHHHNQDHHHHGHGQDHHYIMTKQDVRIASSDLQQTGRKGEWGRKIGGVIYQKQKQINGLPEIIFKIWWDTWCRWNSGEGLRMPFCKKGKPHVVPWNSTGFLLSCPFLKRTWNWDFIKAYFMVGKCKMQLLPG